ncbi:hypothetical protein PIB30_026325 [Stylosanthes scabra]|uniref:Aminotransferase-like plant mobile domain-containing protein n=1 Tax=Stylosanthes scabra TaxID=79078 RepID=A0ABU6XC20_9FABA|nr:hypothetical protein [Stylosanthes scabra]
MAERSIEELAVDDRREMYRLDGISYVAHNVHNERDRCIVNVRRQIMMDLYPRVVPFMQRAGMLSVARLIERWFKIDEPLISAFIERWRACQWLPLGLREPNAIGTGRPRWDWFLEMFGELPEGNERDACIVTFSWLKSRFGDLPRGASDELVVRYARAYIWMLLSTFLFGDKTAAWAHVRWLPFLLRIDELGRQVGVRSPYLAVQESVPSSQQECRPGGRAVGSAAKLDFLAISDPLALRFRRHRVAIGLQVSPTSDEKRPRLQAHRRQLDLMPFREAVKAVLDRCILQEDLTELGMGLSLKAFSLALSPFRKGVTGCNQV